MNSPECISALETNSKHRVAAECKNGSFFTRNAGIEPSIPANKWPPLAMNPAVDDIQFILPCSETVRSNRNDLDQIP